MVQSFGCTVPPDTKLNKLGNSDQEASPSECKNTGVVLGPCCTWKCVSAAISDFVIIWGISSCYLL